MTNELVVIINSLKIPQITKILLYEMKFLVPNYSCLQNHWLRGYRPPDPRSQCPLSSAEFVEPPPNKIPGYATDFLQDVLNSYSRRIRQKESNFLNRLIVLYFSTRSPSVLVTLLSPRAHSGRWSSSGKRVWFTESNIVLVISFYLFYLLNLLLVK